MKKRVISATLLSAAIALGAMTAYADGNPLPRDPAGRWEFFKTNYHAMPNGLKICLLLIAAIIVASVLFYKYAKPAAEPNKPETAADQSGKEIDITPKGGADNVK